MGDKRSILEAGVVADEASPAMAARCDRGALLSRALIAMLIVGSVMTLSTWLVSRQLHFSREYPWKSLLVFALGAALLVPTLRAHHPFVRLGPANTVTLVRASLVATLAALIGEQAPIAPLTATILATLVIALDGCDGWLARRTHMSSAFGARFDMETDAALVAVLAVLVWQFGKVGAWVLLSGAMRYLYAVAAAFIPLLRHPLPPTCRGKTIAVIQMLALLVALAPWSSAMLANAVAMVGLACLTLSFALDIAWLMRHAP